MNLRLRHGDCVEVLKGMKEGSVGAVVSDPPYGLKFMGKAFDNLGEGAAQREWHRGWVEQVYRVLLPGGVLKAFSGTRTVHHLGYALQEAGFVDVSIEAWNYGNGFPKSHDVSKGIDKIDRIGPMEERARAFTAWMRSTGITARQVDDATGTCMGKHYTTHQSQPSVATADLFDLLRPLLPAVPADIEELVRSRTVESENMKRRAVVGHRDMGFAPGTNEVFGKFSGDTRITAPYTDAAQQWQGWGTALKPAWEPVVVGRKP